MSKDKSKPGCLGVFFKTLIVSLFLLGGCVAGVVALGIHFFSWNAQTWTHPTGWSSYPGLAGLGVIMCSVLVAFAAAAFISLASAFLRKGSSKKLSSASSPARPRTQSNRKTTI